MQLNDKTPDQVYRTGENGGAMIVDKYSKKDNPKSIEESGQRRAAASKEECMA